MFDVIVTIVLILFPLLMSIKVVQTYRKTNWMWSLLPIPFFLLTAFAFVIDWVDGFYLLVFGFIIRLIVGLINKKRTSQ